VLGRAQVVDVVVFLFSILSLSGVSIAVILLFLRTATVELVGIDRANQSVASDFEF